MFSGEKKREHGPEMNLIVFLIIYLKTKLCAILFYPLYSPPENIEKSSQGLNESLQTVHKGIYSES